jgi:hypothetical protein
MFYLREYSVCCTCTGVYSPAERMNLAGTGMLQAEQFNVEPWWKAVVVV